MDTLNGEEFNDSQVYEIDPEDPVLAARQLHTLFWDLLQSLNPHLQGRYSRDRIKLSVLPIPGDKWSPQDENDMVYQNIYEAHEQLMKAVKQAYPRHE